MLARCSLCGGESRIDPGQEMLVCSYCGAALAIDKPHGPEHLILTHKRNDDDAEKTLQSFLIEKNRKRPVTMATEFSFVPFLLIEDAEGTTAVAHASRSGSILGGVPYPPAGDYRFFDESCAAGESIVPAENIENGTTTIVHLPVYRIRYEAGNWRGKAAVIGESWQVIAEELPPEKSRAMRVGVILAAMGLFIAYLVIGKLASSLIARIALIATASSGGYLLFSIHQRIAKPG